MVRGCAPENLEIPGSPSAPRNDGLRGHSLLQLTRD